MDTSTDAVVEDVREKRLAIDRRIDVLHGRMQRLNPKQLPWQLWSARAWPFIATCLLAWAWRRYRYNHRFMRLP
jgi:hypothetical protein